VPSQQPPSLQRPDHLDPAPPASGRQLAWLLDHAAGLTSLVVGAVAFLVVTISQREFWAQPSWRLTVPFFVVTLAVTAVAFVRKEKSYALPLLGLGLAAATLVLGWFFLIAAVVFATGLAILVLNHAM
jgi:hypothetical protein